MEFLIIIVGAVLGIMGLIFAVSLFGRFQDHQIERERPASAGMEGETPASAAALSNSLAGTPAPRLNACWFYQAKNGDKVGPVLEEELRMLLAQNEVPHASLVWASHLESWQPANSLDPFITLPPPEPVTPRERRLADIGTDTLTRALGEFAQQLDVTQDDLVERMRLADHTGVSCTKVFARKLGVPAEDVTHWLKQAAQV